MMFNNVDVVILITVHNQLFQVSKPPTNFSETEPGTRSIEFPVRIDGDANFLLEVSDVNVHTIMEFDLPGKEGIN